MAKQKLFGLIKGKKGLVPLYKTNPEIGYVNVGNKKILYYS